MMGEVVSKDFDIIPVSHPTPPAQVWFCLLFFFVEDPEHSDLQYRWKITYKQEQKCQTFEALNMVVLKDSLECFLFWIKRKKKLENFWLF